MTVLLSACGDALSAGAVASSSASLSPVVLPRCPTSVRPQSEIDAAGLPPLVPSGALVRCVLNATVSSSAYDAGYDQAIELTNGQVLHVYERRGGPPAKGGPTQALKSGVRDIGGVTWTWTVLANGATTLEAVVNGTYVEIDLRGDESQVDSLVHIAGALRPVE